MKIKIRRRCKCGCGGITNYGKKYIHGHHSFGNTHNLGKHHSDKTKAKQSLSAMGHNAGMKDKHHSKETCVGMSKRAKERFVNKESHPMYGKSNKWGYHTEEVCLAQSKRMREDNPMENPEVRIAQSIRMTGKNNSNWQGGISCNPYCDIWRDKEYKESIKERDGYKCQNPDCWDTTELLGIHHIDYNKQNCVPLNLISLCISCNVRANTNRDYWQKLYMGIINKNMFEMFEGKYCGQ